MTDSTNDQRSQQIENKLSAARTKLILDKPFLGTLVLRLPLQAANPAWCPTTGTDARKLYYNAEYIEELRADELQFVLAHEALHCGLSHFSRRQHRVKHRWDLACDYAINPILLAEGLKPPPGVMVLPQYEGMSAEEIYPLIDDNDMSESMDQHLYDKPDQTQEGGQDQDDNPLDDQPSKKNQSPDKPADNKDSDSNSGASKQAFDESAGGKDKPPPPLDQAEAEQLSLQWQQRLASASQQAEQSGKLSAVLKRLIEQQRQSLLPWQALLAQYLSATARDDYSYQRPSSRRGDPAIYPTLKSSQINIAIALDVSGSVSDKELNQCVAEMNALKGQLRARITLLVCDADIIEGFPMVFEPWEMVELPQQIAGGGSTDFKPVFECLNRQDQQPDALVYFTDALGTFPQYEPNYPVLWLVKGKGDVPWGQRIQFH
ncbi:vWA domain-containing protein [Leucothrix pacifica]|uniref:Metallopeptidase domain-containing protein n=1 Tax=Leucothrix pacifica TaxID=1247513 RepID=A0A317CHW2_9GAMM|nr:VWA-like domain-containing protein [Leucothrix pacifica]PWQ98156.1 hypothetical protein DKW60_08565 [Leucothrix pacifica]